MREPGRIVADVFAHLTPHVKPGITTLELDTIAETFIRSRGARPSFKGYMGFRHTLCTSINNQVVHGIPGKQILEDGDIEEALNAASAVGDDRIQQQTQGRIVPDAFTHGTSEQRSRWFFKGFKTAPTICHGFVCDDNNIGFFSVNLKNNTLAKSHTG